MKLFVLLSSCFLLRYINCNGDTHPIVRTSFGEIRGINEDGYYSFHNIPYAEPPVGNRRFEPPIPYTGKWSEERDGSQAIISCINFGNFLTSPGYEDCLFVNIATPAITCDQPYPVRLDIHGGAFMVGGPGGSDTSILVKRGMVVVTMGYRLGPLGFLSTGDDVISGNNGLKDQRLAIQWVKSNIGSFCGDPNKIVLSGASAGGASAHLHLLRKSTENYIKGVVSHSGVATCPWAFETNPKVVSQHFGELLNCPTVDSEKLKHCLENKSIEELSKATSYLQPYKGNPFTVFGAVVEPPNSKDPFMTEHPDEIMRNGKAANVTWLVAYTEREGSCNAAGFLKLDKDGKPGISILNERWNELAPIMLFYKNSKTVEEQNKYSTFLKNKYLGEKEFSEDNYRLLEDMYTEVLFSYDIERAVELHRKYCPGTVYVYHYKYPHSFGIGNLVAARTDVTFGADHIADSIFIMPFEALKQKSLSERDKLVAENMLNMYTNFANNGVVSFGGRNIPTKDGKLTINENCFSIDGCANNSDPECNCIEYK